jgi:hypothetical protein
MSAWIGRSSHGKAAVKIVPPDPRIPSWKGLGADSEEKREPASVIDTVSADSLKALDLDRPIREADMSPDDAASAFELKAEITGIPSTLSMLCGARQDVGRLELKPDAAG